jgi:hypothetical protein
VISGALHYGTLFRTLSTLQSFLFFGNSQTTEKINADPTKLSLLRLIRRFVRFISGAGNYSTVLGILVKFLHSLARIASNRAQTLCARNTTNQAALFQYKQWPG